MSSKKGVSIVIGWVLLVGLSVTMGIIVTNWVKSQAEDTTTLIIEDVEGDVRCAETSIKAFIYAPPCTINVSSSGYHKIHKVSVRHQFGTQEYDVNLLPQQGSELLNIGVNTEIDIIPVIEANNQFIACADRKITLSC